MKFAKYILLVALVAVLGVLLLRPQSTQAQGGTVRIQGVSVLGGNTSVNVNIGGSEVVGFSCIGAGPYPQCFVASR
jgi:hypothetical protein